jgi:hypothetical protein
MAEYVEVERARAMSGLRLVLTPGVPGPWSEAAKGVLHVKKLPYVKVRQELGGENRALLDWTAQASAPVMVCNEEWPRSLWNDQLYLAERLQPNPPLVPANLEDRVLMFGYANEICGTNGFGWSKRLMIIRDGLGNPDPAGRQLFNYLANKYGYDKAAAEAAPGRIAGILRALTARLEAREPVFHRRRPFSARHLLGDLRGDEQSAARRAMSDGAGVQECVHEQRSDDQGRHHAHPARASRFHLSQLSRAAAGFLSRARALLGKR